MATQYKTALVSSGAIAAVLTTVLAMPAFAADPPSAAPAKSDITEVVVTAQRRSQRLQDVPISMQALTANNLADRGVTNLKMVTNFIPNVELTNTNRPTAGGSAYAAWIRGVGTGDYAYPTDPGIGIYVDGVYMARTLGGLLSVADIERIEVLRGPQGTLYGRNTIGGAINVVTSTPKLHGPFEGIFSARLGEYGRADAGIQVNTPIVEDKVGFKASFNDFNSDGYGKRIYTNETMNGEHRQVARAGLLFQIAPDFTDDLRVDMSQQRNKGSVAQIETVTGIPAAVARFNTYAAPGQAAAQGLPVGTGYGNPLFSLSGKYASAGTSPVKDDYDIGGLANTMAWNVSDALKLKSITAFRRLHTHIMVDGDNSPFTVSTTDENINDSQFSQEFQASGALWNGGFKYVLGAFYFDETGASAKTSYSFHGVYEVTGLASDARDTFTQQAYRARSSAVYAQADIRLTDQLELSVGGRINEDKKDFTVKVTLPERGNVVSVPLQTRSASWTSFTPRFGLNWKPAKDILVYTSYSEGFKSGGFGSPTATAAAPVYDPEKLSTVEAGVKSQWFDHKLTANFAAYDSTWKDIQLNVIVPGPTGGVVNVTANGGTSHLYGYEAEFTALPTNSLRLNLGVGYTHNEFTDLAAGAVTAGVTLTSKLPHVPEWSVTPGIQYDWDTSFGQFMVRTDASYRSSQYLTIGDPGSFEKGYTLVSARLALRPAFNSNLELALEGSNLTDQHYLVYEQAASIFGIRISQPGDPRMISATAKLRF